jgi:C-methyltransferase C-terminal domain/Putative zinc binding domain/Methyltransferase domain
MDTAPVMACRCCGASTLVPVLDLGSQPWGNDFIKIEAQATCARYPLVLFVCTTCTMAQIGHTVPKETMFVRHNYISGTTRRLRTHFEDIARDILARIPFGPHDYVLDIGGNDGTFLVPIRERGVGVLNIESATLQAELSARKGLPTVNRFFNREAALDLRREHGPARVIHGSGVFFHLEELHSAFEGVKHLLHHNGVVVAEFIYLPTMIEQCAFDQVYHEHLVYYTMRSLSRLLGQHGLRVADAALNPIHGGSCIAWITHDDAAPQTMAVSNLLQREEAAGFGGLGIYRDFALRVGALKTSLVSKVRQLRAAGMRVQALGAPVKGSTILNYCGFDHEDIECAVEVNEFKVGTYYPGTRIPVRHQDAVKAPDVYLLLAWNFREEILAKLAVFRASGGRILVPIPTPEMI